MSESTPDGSVFDTIDPSSKVVSVEIDIQAPAEDVFELIADPTRQPEWDGNDNLSEAAEGQRVHSTGESFVTTLTKGVDRENHIVDFEEGRRIAWMPSEVGGEPFGQRWSWEIVPVGGNAAGSSAGGAAGGGGAACLVRQTYDWTQLRDLQRLPRAQSTTTSSLLASMKRLKALAED